jgi:hypothetical protein
LFHPTAESWGLSPVQGFIPSTQLHFLIESVYLLAVGATTLLGDLETAARHTVTPRLRGLAPRRVAYCREWGLAKSAVAPLFGLQSPGEPVKTPALTSIVSLSAHPQVASIDTRHTSAQPARTPDASVPGTHTPTTHPTSPSQNDRASPDKQTERKISGAVASEARTRRLP